MPVMWTFDGTTWRAPGATLAAATPTMIMGMTNNQPNEGLSTTSIADYMTIRPRMGGAALTGRRTFNPNMPATFSSSYAASDAANGLTSFWSFKQDIAEVIAGTHDTALATLGASIPDGAWVTSYHEPEAAALAAEFKGANLGRFKTYMQKIYSGLKTGNANINVGYCAMAFQWGEWNGLVWDDWYPGDAYCDFCAVDVYEMEFEPLESIEAKADFMRWHSFAAATGKPLQVWEWGITWGTKVTAHPAGRVDSAVAPVIGSSIDWLADNDFGAVLYWNCTDLGTAYPDGVREWAISGTDGAVGDNRPQSRAAWLDRVATYSVAA